MFTLGRRLKASGEKLPAAESRSSWCSCLIRSEEVTRELFFRAYHFGGLTDGGLEWNP